MSINMRTDWDCGPVAACNHLGKPDAYDTLTATQPIWWPFRDLWDSPSRMIAMLESASGQKAALVPTNPLLVPCVALVKQRGSWLYAHWITILGVDVSRGIYRWHDGVKERTDSLPWDIEMAIAVGGVIPLPWHWRLWGALTGWIRRL